MSGQSGEFIEELFSKIESRTQYVIAMMDEVQDKFIHKFRDIDGEVQCYEKKVISGFGERLLRYSTCPLFLVTLSSPGCCSPLPTPTLFPFIQPDIHPLHCSLADPRPQHESPA